MRGRPQRPGKRKNGKPVRIAIARDYGNDKVQARRELFRGVRKNAEGKTVDVSDDIADAVGQLHALGYFDGHGHLPELIRDMMRRYGEAYWARNADKAPRVGTYAAFMGAGDGSPPTPPNSFEALSFKGMTRALEGMLCDQRCLELLVCEYWWKDELPMFAQCLIDEKLIALGRRPDHPIELPGINDHDILAGALRATFRLIEAGLQVNERRAA